MDKLYQGKHLKKKLIDYLHTHLIKSLSKKKKKEKSSTAWPFLYICKKKINFLNTKHKLNLSKSISRKSLTNTWDNEKKVIFFFKEIENLNLFLSKKFCIHTEQFLNSGRIYKKSLTFKDIPPFFEYFLCTFKAHSIAHENFLFSVLKNSRYNLIRFCLKNESEHNPVYICWSNKKNSNIMFNILLNKKTLEYNFYHSISVLLIKLNPMPLKMAYFQAISFVFLSIENGFCINCFIYKKYKKKKLVSYLLYFFYQEYKLLFFR